MLHRSSIINKIVINIMIIEVMYKAKLPHSFVDSRPLWGVMIIEVMDKA